ncbi:MAG: ATP-binding protein [Kiritimatiellae bacterium]|nr:ATP-binding protein [Kiritimatiellia bacterium]
MDNYRKRIVDELLDLKLSSSAAVLVEGTKWCGKTTTCLQVAKSSIFMDEPTKREQNIELASISPAKLLSGEYPRLIDEWQIAPQLWDAIRYKADRESIIGGYMITGSAVPVDINELKHSGTGRFSWLKMRPMSLWESGESSGSVSLAELFRGRRIDAEEAHPFELEQMAEIVCRGGWPQSLLMNGRAKFETSKNVLQAIVQRDISRVDGTERNPDRALKLMRSYARIQGTQATAKVIMADLSTNEMSDMIDDTVYSYLNALRKLFVIEDSSAWCPNLRTKDSIRTSDTRYFVDPSIATAALGFGPGELLNDLKTFGFLFETMVIRDLRVYAEALGGEVRHYHDKTGLECDAVIHLPNGTYALLEVKIGGKHLIEEGTRTLNNLARLISVKKLREPEFKMVITAVGEYAYVRKEDGIIVCPISALKS